MNLKTITIIGANGTMGCNIAAIFASFGNAKVYMVSRDIENSKKSIERAIKSVRADSIAKNLIPADYSQLEDCIDKSDLVFESVAEDFEIKSIITKRVADALKKNAIACSGTSGLSLTKLSELLPEDMRSNYMGIHMFNPPYNLNLCELIPTKYTDKDLLNEMKNYLSKVLLRTVVEVKDSPAFLGNRIGFQFINEALQYAEKYKYSGGIDYIDAILGSFTGRSMAPIATSDFVGLDVHKAIVNNLYENTNDYARNTYILPEFVQKLILEGRLGKKTNCGFYQKKVLDSGEKINLVYDITTASYRDKIKYVFPFTQSMITDFKIGDYTSAFKTLVDNKSVEAEICVEFLLKYIIYSLYCTNEVGYDIYSADDVMASGFNWCPPLAMIEAFETETDFKELVKERLDSSILKSVDIDLMLINVNKSKYDYRRYFKSSR